MLLYRAADKQILELESTLSPPGLLPADTETEFTPIEVPWRPGDILLVYSDGLSEAQNAAGQMYGVERIKGLLHGASDLGPQAILNAILADLEHFLVNGRAKDDLTLVAAKAS